MNYNKQLADYIARAMADVPDGEIITTVEADNDVRNTSGEMLVYVNTLELDTGDRKQYMMLADGLKLVSTEVAL